MGTCSFFQWSLDLCVNHYQCTVFLFSFLRGYQCSFACQDKDYKVKKHYHLHLL
uniref:Uncharacterized protein n=1 Tax=Arundo donax TaxID=35708 RepID=A0A0A8Z1R6_ARUDO